MFTVEPSITLLNHPSIFPSPSIILFPSINLSPILPCVYLPPIHLPTSPTPIASPEHPTGIFLEQTRELGHSPAGEDLSLQRVSWKTID